MSTGIICAFLLPASAWAGARGIANADLTVIAGGSAAGTAMPSPLALTVTPVSDAELATEEAKGLPASQAVIPQVVQPPKVTLWDEIDPPGWSPTGIGVTVVITGEQ